MERVFLKSGFYSWRGSLLTFAKNIPTQGASKLGRRHCSLLPGMKPVDPKGRDSADHGTTFPVVPSLVRAGALVAEIEKKANKTMEPTPNPLWVRFALWSLFRRG